MKRRKSWQKKTKTKTNKNHRSKSLLRSPNHLAIDLSERTFIRLKLGIKKNRRPNFALHSDGDIATALSPLVTFALGNPRLMSKCTVFAT